jgi:ABC-type proline/glycine betaine transport system substrate-binding protein
VFGLLEKTLGSANVEKVEGISSINSILAVAANALIGIGFSVSFICVAYAMIQYTLSSGDPKALERSWRTFINGVIAALVSIGAVALKIAIFNLLGVNIPES